MGDQALEQSQDVVDRMANFFAPEEEEQAEQPQEDNEQEPVEAETEETQEEETEQVEGEEETEEANLVEVEVDGELYAVPEALKDKIMLQADYTRKTQEVAEQRKQVEQAQAQLQLQAQLQQQSLAEYAQLVALDQQLQNYQQVDWNALYEQDPAEFVRVKEARRDLLDNRTRLANQIQQQQQQQFEQQNQIRIQAIDEGQKILAREIPNWNTELAKTLNTFAVSKFGFTADEVNAVIDPRVVKLLHTAYLYDKQKTNKPITDKRVQNLPKVSKPTGKTGNAQVRTDLQKLQERFKRTGSIEDGAALMLARMSKK